MSDGKDNDLDKKVKELVQAEVKKFLSNRFDMTSKQIVINPLDIDPDSVPSGPYQFNGFVVNSAASDSITLALWTYANTGDSSAPLMVTRMPPTGRHWTTVAILAASTDYGLQAILTDSTGATTYSTSSIFFSAID